VVDHQGNPLSSVQVLSLNSRGGGPTIKAGSRFVFPKWNESFRVPRGSGTYGRWIDTGPDLIYYEHVSKAAANRFDRLIDSMCWLDSD